MVKLTPQQRAELEALEAMPDDQIDYSDIPELDPAVFAAARVVGAPGKKRVTVRLDRDVLAWLQSQGKGYQTRINAILRAYYEAQADRGAR